MQNVVNIPQEKHFYSAEKQICCFHWIGIFALRKFVLGCEIETTKEKLDLPNGAGFVEEPENK